MKYLLMILTLIMLVGIGSAADLSVYNAYYVTANTNYDWTLTKLANRDSLEFIPAPDPEPEAVVFTIDITRSVPYSLTQKYGTIYITNNGSNPVNVTRVKDSIAYMTNYPTPGPFVDDTILFEGNHTILAGQTWNIPFVFTFTTIYPLGPFAYHYNYVKVLTDSNELFQFVDAFHVDFPGVVNETLHVWDQITVPAQFSYIWDYNGPWKALDDTTFIINVSFTNQSATTGTYTAKNYAYGINECGLWMDSVIMRFYVEDTTPPDTFQGRGFTPGYWKNHPEAFDQWLPITIATVTVTTVPQAVTILSTNNPAWPRFLKFFLAMKFNCLYDPGMLGAYYNDTSKTGEFMENQTVAYILGVADGYTSSTPVGTLNAMKNVFDKICNNEGVLWLTPQGVLSESFALPTTSSFTLVPNPFSNLTEIRFLTEIKELVTVSVYDVSGIKVRDLVKNANSTLYWDGTNNNGVKLNRGVYIIRANNATLKALISR